MSKQTISLFGEYIRALRENSGLPIKKAALQLDIDPSLLGKIERNERQPTRSLISRIAKKFSQDENFLMRQFISDQVAYKIYEEGADLTILKVAEKKIKYLRKENKKIYAK